MMSLPDFYFEAGNYVIYCRILNLYPAVTNSLKENTTSRSNVKSFSQNCTKVVISKKKSSVG